LKGKTPTTKIINAQQKRTGKTATKMFSNWSFLFEIPFQLLFGNVYHLYSLFLQ